MNDNNNSQNTFKCSGDCLRCSVQQRIYCSSQMSRNMVGMMETVLSNQTAILERLERLERANEPKDEGIVNPMAEAPSESTNEPNLDNAQDDAGAENRASL